MPVFIVQVTKLVHLTNIIHFRKFHRRHQCTLQHVWGRHINIFGICEDARHFSQHSYNVTINSHNGKLTLHTDSHARGKDNNGRQIETTAQWNSSNSETVRNRTHVHIQIFCLEWPIPLPPRILTFPPETFCILNRLICSDQYKASGSLSYSYIHSWQFGASVVSQDAAAHSFLDNTYGPLTFQDTNLVSSQHGHLDADYKILNC
jgi:hypothetical protein